MKNRDWNLVNRVALPARKRTISSFIDKAQSDVGVIHAKPARNAISQGFVSTLLRLRRESKAYVRKLNRLRGLMRRGN